MFPLFIPLLKERTSQSGTVPVSARNLDLGDVFRTLGPERKGRSKCANKAS